MGPVGILCVQRTLNEGRMHGLVTGLGAVVGDMIIAFLAIIAALGMGFSTTFIQQHQDPLQAVGSVILIIFGYYVFRKNPSRNLAVLKENKMPYWQVFISSLILTVSNIGTLFLYIALFARFNIIDSTKPFAFDMLTVLIIGIGALCWWLLITWIVNRIRSRFNVRGLQIFNRIVGTILVLIGIVGIATAIG
jgi:threonine/homoserine/homoserine lactone efflux protein